MGKEVESIIDEKESAKQASIFKEELVTNKNN